MKIAFVRGPFLNPWELQTYLPLAQRHEVRFIGADWEQFQSYFKDSPVKVAHLHVWAASASRLHPKLTNFLNRLCSWTFGASYGLVGLEQATTGAQILHAVETYSTMTYQCLQIRQRRPCKVVATIWENLPNMGETHPLRRARKRQALKELDGFLAVTETARRVLVEEGAPAERIEVIPMAVDLLHFKPAPRDPDSISRWMIKPGEKIVLFVGRWVEEKGITELLRAIPDVIKASKTPVRFCLVGSGPLEPRLRQAERDFPGRILLIPFASYDQLPQIHNLADVFVLPSKPTPKWEEQFGYVLAESMACGKAIVTTRSGSIPDVVGDAAVLVEPGNASGLAKALMGLLDSGTERQRLGELAFRRARDCFDTEKNARRIETFYERILRQV